MTATPDGPLVAAAELRLVAGRRTVWSGLDFELGTGLSAVGGVSGAGKSTVLLALTGRMSGLAGSLTVAGLDAIAQARRVRAITSVARIATMIDLEGRLTVAESVTERALTDRIPTGAAADRISELAEQVGLELDRDRLVDDLDALDRTLLTVCLAQLRPAVLTVLDDADRDLTVAEQRGLYQALTALAGDRTAIVVGTREPAALPPGTPLVELADPRRPVLPDPSDDQSDDSREDSPENSPDDPSGNQDDTRETPTPEPKRSR